MSSEIPTDTAVEPTPWYRRPRFLGILAIVAVAIIVGSYLRQHPGTGRILAQDIEVAAVHRGEFVNELSTLCDFQPNSSFKLDTADGGRVVIQYVEASAVVDKNQSILLLDNPELESELMRRTAEHLEHLSALATLQLEFERLDLEINERLISLEAAVRQRSETHNRLTKLVVAGLVAQSDFEESENEIARLTHLIETVQISKRRTHQVRDRQLESTEQSAEALKGQLERIQRRIDALQIRAPAPGLLALIDVLPGQQLQPGAEIGEVYTEGDFSIRCAIDERYLQDIEVATTKAELGTPEHSYQLGVTSVFPTVTNGRFVAELGFLGDRPEKMSKGQSARLRIALRSAGERLLLPVGDYLRESGGTWVFVQQGDQGTAVKRDVRMGKRNSSSVEVLGGLDEKELVIISSYANLTQFETLEID